MPQRNISLSRKSSLLHVEAPGCIVNIHPGLTDTDGRAVVRVSIEADGDRYSGDPQWWVEGVAGARGHGVRVIQTDTPSAPVADAADVIAEACGIIRAMRDAAEAQDGGNPVWARGMAFVEKQGR